MHTLIYLLARSKTRNETNLTQLSPIQTTQRVGKECVNLRFQFTSSVGSAQGWDNLKGPVPEEVQLDPSVAVGAGYGEGKYATERVIVRSVIHATSLRIGQIVGGHGGSWATTDWFPILVKSSIALGVLPDAIGGVSWLREEDVASAILETAFAREAPPPALNIVNPRSAPWAKIIVFV
ncbi:hypothetical protein EV363DRAFT_1584581 [Boletus edulis]|nr:hypothetical protein EV363DRAFT_1584581 [Boletus edulis]